MFKFKAVVLIEFEAENTGEAWETIEEITDTINMEYPDNTSYPVSLECHGESNGGLNNYEIWRRSRIFEYIT